MIFLVIGIIVSGSAGYCIAYVLYIPQIDELESDYDTLTVMYETLETQRDDLQSQYYTLSSQYSSLQIDYNSLSNDYDELLEYSESVSSNIWNLKELLSSYCFLEESFQRVLCNYEVEKTASTVSSITNPTDSWYSYEAINLYITFNIEYVNDIQIPYIDKTQQIARAR